MPKGVMMVFAHQDGTVVRARDIRDDDKKQPFTCEGCGVSVSHVHEYWMRADDPLYRRRVPAFFRLPSNGNHLDRCKYTPSGQVAALVNDAHAIDDDINPFQHVDDSAYVFRLNILSERRKTIISFLLGPGATDEEYRYRVKRLWTGGVLDPYCRSATGLAKIWRSLEDSRAKGEFAKIVRLRHNGKDIQWSEFFFGPENYAALANRLKRRTILHPAAVLVHVQKIGRSQADNPMVTCTAEPSNRAKTDVRISFRLFGDEKLLNKFIEGHHYIVFGRFRVMGDNPFNVPGSSRSITYRNLALQIYQAGQFCEVETPENKPRP